MVRASPESNDLSSSFGFGHQRPREAKTPSADSEHSAATAAHRGNLDTLRRGGGTANSGSGRAVGGSGGVGRAAGAVFSGITSSTVGSVFGKGSSVPLFVRVRTAARVTLTVLGRINKAICQGNGHSASKSCSSSAVSSGAPRGF